MSFASPMLEDDAQASNLQGARHHVMPPPPDSRASSSWQPTMNCLLVTSGLGQCTQAGARGVTVFLSFITDSLSACSLYSAGTHGIFLKHTSSCLCPAQQLLFASGKSPLAIYEFFFLYLPCMFPQLSLWFCCFFCLKTPSPSSLYQALPCAHSGATGHLLCGRHCVLPAPLFRAGPSSHSY